MPYCPQCGTNLGEDARGCTCGWRSSRRTLWIVLSIVGGLLVLVCGGCLTISWLAIRGLQAHATPALLLQYRIQVVQYARTHGGVLPGTLEAALADPVEPPGEAPGAPPRRHRRIRLEGGGGRAVDSWLRGVRYTVRADGTFEIRSAGPDGAMDGPDDVVEVGRPGEDLDALGKELERRFEEVGRRAFGFGGGGEEVVPEGTGEKPGPAEPPPAEKPK